MFTLEFVIKTVLSAILIALISILSKKLPWIGALLASLPLTSILAMLWLYRDTQSIDSVASLSNAIFWMIVPSLVFFLVLPFCLKWVKSFYAGFGLAIVLMILGYSGFVWILKLLKIDII